jgi:hypothetical protein
MHTARQREQLNEAAHIIHYHIQERCKLLSLHYPTIREVRDKVILALVRIESYKNIYGVNANNRDMIKYFAFTIPLLIQEWDREEKEKMGRAIKGDVFYLAFFDYIASSYRDVIDISKHPDIANTCRILSQLSLNDNELATYAYFKGMTEACICAW